MTPAEVKAYVLGKLHITNAEFTDNFISLGVVANMELIDICGAIALKNEGYFGVYGTIPLVADRREYPIPDDMLNNLIMVEADFDGTGNWKRLNFVNVNDIKDFIFSESWITTNYSNDEPEAFIFRQSVFILSGTIAAMPEGLRLWYVQLPDPIPSMDGTTDLSVATCATTTFKIGFPTSFHKLLARAMIMDYKEANEIPFTGREVLYDQDLEKQLNKLTPLNRDEEIFGRIPFNDGSDL